LPAKHLPFAGGRRDNVGRPLAEFGFPVNVLPVLDGYMSVERSSFRSNTRNRSFDSERIEIRSTTTERGIPLNSDSSNYEALVRPHEDQMLRSIWRITRVAEDAEDALQESLTIIWKRRARIAQHPRPRALVLRICVHCACDVLRARLRRGSRETAMIDPEAFCADARPVDRELCGRELRDDIARALVRLPSRQAAAVVMRHILELPYQEIGDALGCSETTARVHVNRACKKLSRLLAHLAVK
jgi:RNA polymerase sigma-70 factor, ECF subfamily